MYHSSALLMPDGSVLVSGSNPNTGATGSGPYPTEYRTQLFFPPYAAWGVSRNVLTDVSHDTPSRALMRYRLGSAGGFHYSACAGIKVFDL